MLLAQLGLRYERVTVDIFDGESQTPGYLARNPAGRTPLLETGEDAFIPESGAILLYLAEGSPLLPSDRLERAHVHAWMFFEQNLFEPNVGTARFWRLTGRDAEKPEAFARHLEAGRAALETLERGLAEAAFLAGGRYTVADCALYGYAHVAHEAGYDMAAYPAVQAWLARVAELPGRPATSSPTRRRRTPAREGGRQHDLPLGNGVSGHAVRSCAISSNAATNRSQSSSEWVIDSVHSSSRPGVM